MWRCAAERAAHSGNFQGRRMFQAGFKPMMWLNLPAVFPPSARLIGLLKTVTASPPRCSTEEIKHKRNRNRREVSCAWNGNKATSANLFLLHVLFSSTLQKDKPCFSLFIHNKTGDELSWAPLQAFTCQRPEHSNPLLFYPPELICLFFICAVWLQKKRKNKLQPSSPLMSVRVFFFNKQCQTFAAESSLNVKICCCSDIQSRIFEFSTFVC